MKKKKNQKPLEPQASSSGRPTLLEFLASIHSEANRQFGTTFLIDPELAVPPLPNWGRRTVAQLGKTILRPILKLRPTKKVTCQDFGKLIGILNRGITFYLEDAPRMIEEEGLDEISEEKWETIQPRDQLRAHIVKQLGRPVGEGEALEDLETELFEKRINGYVEMRTRAFQIMAQRSAKDNVMFHRGMAQGYEAFMDAYGHFCGDRGRTEIYTELLSSMYEIEKMRRTFPPRNDSDLYDHLKPWYRFPNGRESGVAWLRKVCDDISLYMTGKRGRPFGPRRAIAF